MRRLITTVLVAGVVTGSFCAETPAPLLREALAVAQTNLPAALKLSDRAVADFPTNAQALSVRARLLDRARRYEDALRDFSAALKLEPKVTQLWQPRGETHFRAGHFKESVADFDRVLELAPDQAPYHWQRGISLYYADRFADGRKQFELHRTVNPRDVENAAWHFLCAAREQGVTNARTIILPVGEDGRVPMREINALYRGTGSAEAVLKAADATGGERRNDARFYAHLYLGLYYDVLGDIEKARQHIKKAATEFDAPHYMGDVARVHWRRLNPGSGL